MFVKMSETTVKRVNTVSPEWQGSDHVARPDSSFINHLFETAMTFTMKRSDEEREAVISKMKKNDEWMNSTWRYALAKSMADAMRSNPHFINLHLLGSVVSDSARLTSDINLVLHVDEDKENFERWVALTDEQLTSRFRDEFGLSEGFLSLINCHVVTNEEVTKRAGYAALLTSPHSNVISL